MEMLSLYNTGVGSHTDFDKVREGPQIAAFIIANGADFELTFVVRAQCASRLHHTVLLAVFWKPLWQHVAKFRCPFLDSFVKMILPGS